MKTFAIIAFGLIIPYCLTGQKEYHVACVAFYNLENLFDTIDSPDTDDLEFTPAGANLYNSKVYFHKLGNLAKVLDEICKEYTPDGPALIGVSEIENRSVLEDLVRQPALALKNYKILHKDSKDARGIDVALLYQSKYFTPDTTWYYSLITSDAEALDTTYSRDILVAAGRLLDEQVVITVNHWPSRRGGELATATLRKKAAEYNRKVLDTLMLERGITKSIVMGDLNDDPANDSVKKILKASRTKNDLQPDEMYNPWDAFYRRGLGTTAYRDAWSLFDQIILGPGFTDTLPGIKYYKAEIFNPSYLTQHSGNYKGYPFRSYSSGEYTGGYSDHFPVYVMLIKERS